MPYLCITVFKAYLLTVTFMETLNRGLFGRHHLHVTSLFCTCFTTAAAVGVETWKRIWRIPTGEGGSGKARLSRTAERNKDYYIQVCAKFITFNSALWSL